MLFDKLIIANSQREKNKIEKELMEISKENTINLIEFLSHSNTEIRKSVADIIGFSKNTIAVKPLIETLSDIDEDVRKNSARSLGRLGENEALEPLIIALNDDSSKVRDWVAWSLGWLGDPIAIEPLLKLVEDKSLRVSKTASEAITNIETKYDEEEDLELYEEEEWERKKRDQTKIEKIIIPKAINKLVKELGSGNEDQRWRAAESLGMINDSSINEPLIHALYDTSIAVKIKSIESISILEIKEAVPILIKFLEHEHLGLKKKAIETLGWLKDSRASEYLIEILNDVEEPSDIRKRSAWALGEIGDVKVVNSLLNYLDYFDEDIEKLSTKALVKIGLPSIERVTDALTGWSNKTRNRAAWILSEIKEPETAFLIMERAQEIDAGYKGFSKVTMNILGKLGEAAVEPLIDFLDNKDTNKRRRAIWGLQRIGYPAVDNLIESLKVVNNSIKRRILGILIGIGKPSVKYLINLLRSKDDSVRLAAIIALGEIKEIDAVEPLIRQLNDPNNDLRLETSLALGFLENKTAIDPLVDLLMVEQDLNVKRAIAESLYTLGWQPKNSEHLFVFLSLLRFWEEIVNYGEIAIDPLISAFSDYYYDDFEVISDSLVKIGGQTIERLRIALEHSNSWIRKGASKTLLKMDWQPNNRIEEAIFLVARQDWGGARKLGSIAEKALLNVMSDENNSVRFFASQTLKKIGWHPETDIENITFLIGTQKWSKVSNFGTKATPLLIQAIKDPDVDIRRGVVGVLGDIKDTNAVYALISALKDEDAYVRLYAVEALGEIRDPRVIEPLITAKEDEDGYVRQAAQSALTRIPINSLTETKEETNHSLKIKIEKLPLNKRLIYVYIKLNPGSAQIEIINSINIAPRTVRYLLRSLSEAGIIQKTITLTDTRNVTYFIVPFDD